MFKRLLVRMAAKIGVRLVVDPPPNGTWIAVAPWIINVGGEALTVDAVRVAGKR